MRSACRMRRTAPTRSTASSSRPSTSAASGGGGAGFGAATGRTSAFCGAHQCECHDTGQLRAYAHKEGEKEARPACSGGADGSGGVAADAELAPGWPGRPAATAARRLAHCPDAAGLRQQPLAPPARLSKPRAVLNLPAPARPPWPRRMHLLEGPSPCTFFFVSHIAGSSLEQLSALTTRHRCIGWHATARYRSTRTCMRPASAPAPAAAGTSAPAHASRGGKCTSLAITTSARVSAVRPAAYASREAMSFLAARAASVAST